MSFTETLQSITGKLLADCTDQELYLALLELVRQKSADRVQPVTGRKLYYISAEFLIGKLLSNNLINLGLYEEARDALAAAGKRLSDIEEVEPEPSLGNGGLGRLAACFLDSLATLNLPGDGVGLRYHFGLFHQSFEDGVQNEKPDPWLTAHSWAEKTDITYPVELAGKAYTARLYKLAVTGYEGRTNTLNLFDLDTIDESIVHDGIAFDKTAIDKNLTLFLYPDDSDEAGRRLRVYQQYLMVSAGAQLILAECAARGCNYHDLADYAAIQINDTHPSMVIPELIRILTTEEGFTMDEAIDVVSHTCAYTNHTILAEALEKWPLAYIEEVVPQLVPIIKELSDRVAKKYKDEKVQIIDKDKRVHMAHIDIHYGYSVNGVAAIHTEILKQSELNHFYKIYPEKFNNKTNGITFRRWLLSCNHELAAFLTQTIGDGYKKDADELQKLLEHKDDQAVLDAIYDIKKTKKTELVSYIKDKEGVELNPDSIFDIQVKRLHEYKRQQMNALYIIHKYLEIKGGKKPSTPLTFIFGAKAAPAYVIAQDIIHLILCLQQLINNDPEVSPYLNVVMVENYNVTWAEKLIPACDISEQISLASKEASGTGNMKFMLNGALTLGTEDGANVEIHELVGDDNIYIFGDSSDTVVERYAQGSYHAAKYYNENAAIKEAVDFITGEELKAIGDKDRLERLFNELVSKDWFMTFPDFDEYVKTREQAYADYENREEWVQKMLVNIAKAGYFSSDRTIEEYNRDIWKLED